MPALLAAAELVLARAGPARAQNVLAKAIERAQPCKDVKATAYGIAFGLDTFKSAALEKLRVDVDGDAARVFAIGSLACRTSDGAIVRGDASASFDVSAEVDLASRTVARRTFRVLSTGGTYGFAVRAAKDRIDGLVEDAIDGQVMALCR